MSSYLPYNNGIAQAWRKCMQSSGRNKGANPYLEKKADNAKNHQGGMVFCLNCQGDNQALLGETIAKRGPLCVYWGSYQASDPEVFTYIKLPKGIEKTLNLEAKLSNAKIPSDYTIETFYCLQGSLYAPADALDKKRRYFVLKPHPVVFNAEEMLSARLPEEKEFEGPVPDFEVFLLSYDDQTQSELRSLRVQIEARLTEEGWFAFPQTEDERERKIFSAMMAALAANQRFKDKNVLLEKAIDVSIFNEIAGEKLQFLIQGNSNTYVSIHEGLYSPFNFVLEEIPQWEGQIQFQYLTSIVIIPIQKKVVITVHRIVPSAKVSDLKVKLAPLSEPTFGTLHATLGDQFPEFGVMEEAIQRLSTLEVKQERPPLRLEDPLRQPNQSPSPPKPITPRVTLFKPTFSATANVATLTTRSTRTRRKNKRQPSIAHAHTATPVTSFPVKSPAPVDTKAKSPLARVELTEEKGTVPARVSKQFLMLDPSGIFGGEWTPDLPGPNDLLLEKKSNGYVILKNGVLIIDKLNQLVDHYNYHLVFHSQATEEEQISRLILLKRACQKKQIQFPRITAMSVCDPKFDAHAIEDPFPAFQEEHEIQIAAYSKDEPDKTNSRKILSTLLGIRTQEREESIIFDEDKSVVAKAEREGYQVKSIGNSNFDTALNEVLQTEAVYKRILDMTNAYIDEHKDIPDGDDELLRSKKRFFNDLHTILVNPENPGESKYKRLEKYAQKLSEAPQDINEHRTNVVLRYVVNALSILVAFLPALGRIAHSSCKYHTPQFWKPQSEKIKLFALSECKKISIVPKAGH